MSNGGQAQSTEPPQSGSASNKSREIHKEISVTIRRTMFTMIAYSAACAASGAFNFCWLISSYLDNRFSCNRLRILSNSWA